MWVSDFVLFLPNDLFRVLGRHGFQIVSRGAFAGHGRAGEDRKGSDTAAKDDGEDIAYGCLSCNLVMLGAFQEAFLVLERGIALNPNNVELLNARAFANVFAPDGDFQQVISDSEYALELSPNDPMRWTFLTNIGMAHLADEESGSLQGASEAFLKATMKSKAS